MSWLRSKYEEDSLCSLIDSSGEVAKSLLTGCIPDLKFNSEAVDLGCFHFEVDSYGGDVGLRVICIDVSEEQVGLSDGGISNDCHLRHGIVILLLHYIYLYHSKPIWDLNLPLITSRQ